MNIDTTSNSNEKLKNYLIKFKELTLQLINSVEKEDYDSLDFLINERQRLIEEMEGLDYTTEKFKDICTALQVLPLQQKLTLLMNNSKNKIRHELDKMAASKTANKNYNKGFRVDSIFFNKKI